jgi:hypothetical protein
MTITRAATSSLLALTLLLTACGDDSSDVRAGDGTTTTTPGDGTTTTADAGGTSPAGSGVVVPDTPGDITGTITSVVVFVPVTEDCTPADELDPDGTVSSDDPPVCTPADNDIVGTVLVEEQPGVQEGRKISFTVTSSTTLAGPDGTALAGFDDLAEGQTVQAWSTGMCAESYPEQCGATVIQRTA